MTTPSRRIELPICKQAEIDRAWLPDTATEMQPFENLLDIKSRR